MKRITLFIALFIVGLTYRAAAQAIPTEVSEALKKDDAKKIATFITKENINNCYEIGDWQYSLLAQTIRENAKHCFDYLIAQGADVNKACDGYVPPLFHAAKYGSLEMVKILVAKGAKVDYKYEGEYAAADGQTPLTYAEANKQNEIADYLRSLKK